jgi:DNA invertase Pin-like site-specific DNA recombinase
VSNGSCRGAPRTSAAPEPIAGADALVRRLPTPDTKPVVILLPSEADLRFRILTRVSDDKLQSIPQQVRDCYEYAVRGGRGVAVDGLYNLGEHSGFSITESEAYQQLMQDARERRFHGLVVRDSSRLGRDYWEKMGTLRDLRAAGVELHIVEDGGRFDFEDRLSKVTSFASTWADEQKKGEEIRKSIRATASLRDEGLPTVKPPFGYASARDAKRMRRVWRPTRDADTVRAVFAAVAADPALNRSALARAHRLRPDQLHRILQNRAYTGGFVWKGAFHRVDADVIPPLVDEATFEAVQRRAGEG